MDIDVNAVSTDSQPGFPSTKRFSSKNCKLTLQVGDVNEAPIWNNWEYTVTAMENEPPKTILSTPSTNIIPELQVNDPESDQITYSIQSSHKIVNGAPSTDCTGLCDWFEIGSCDGKLRVKAGASVTFSPNLSLVGIIVEATDSGGLKATTDINGATRAHAYVQVSITNLAEPPVITGPASFSVDENIVGCDVIGEPPAKCRLKSLTPNTNGGSIIATDPDGSILTYHSKILNDPNFYIVETTGAVYIKKLLNYEHIPSLVLQVKVDDVVDNFNAVHSFTVAIINKNDPVSFY